MVNSRLTLRLATAILGILICVSGVPAKESSEILRYVVTWNGAKAGHGDITTKSNSRKVDVTVHAVSDGALRKILEVWSRVKGSFSARSFRPRNYQFLLRSNLLRTEVVDLQFDHKSGHVTICKQKGDEKERHKEKLASYYDPVTAGCLLRSQRHFRKPMRVDIFDGKDKARLFIRPAARGQLTVKGGSFPAVGLDVRLVKLTGDKKEIGKGRLWLSNDRYRIPLLLISSALIGKVRFELVKVER
ncbi:DUF3108 domain-containing protein [Thermodesulfobacteriota bacterium]